VTCLYTVNCLHRTAILLILTSFTYRIWTSFTLLWHTSTPLTVMFRFVVFALILFPLSRHCDRGVSIGLWTPRPTSADLLHCDPLTSQRGWRIASSLHNVHFIHQMAGKCGEFYRPRLNNSFSSMVIALLLLMAGIEINPGPAISNGSSNARSTVISRRSEIRLGSLNADHESSGHR